MGALSCLTAPAAPSHGLCGSAGGLPSQSPNGDSSPEGRAKSRLPPWGRWTRVSEDGEGKMLTAPAHGLCGSVGRLPSQSRLPPCQLPQRGSQVSPPPLGGAGAQWAPFSAWSPLPRRSVMDAAHWAASPEPAGESAPAGGGGGKLPASQPSPGETTFSALRRPGKTLRCFPSFSLADAH